MAVVIETSMGYKDKHCFGLGPLICLPPLCGVRETQFTPEELLGMMLNYSRGLAQDFAGQCARCRRSSLFQCEAYSLASSPSTRRTTGERCGDHGPGLLQPGGAAGRAAGGADGRPQGSAAHQRQHRRGPELRRVQEERYRQYSQGAQPALLPESWLLTGLVMFIIVNKSHVQTQATNECI